MIIAYDKSVRKREQYNPADYEPLPAQGALSAAVLEGQPVSQPALDQPGVPGSAYRNARTPEERDIVTRAYQAPLTTAPQQPVQLVQPVAPGPAPTTTEPVLDLSGVPGYERMELEARVAANPLTYDEAPIDPAQREAWATRRMEFRASQAPGPGVTDESRTAEYQRVQDIQTAAVEKGRADRAAAIDKRRASMGLAPLTPKAEAAPGPLPDLLQD